MDDMNPVQLIEQFADEKKCRDYLLALRWPDGIECPHCKSKKISRIQYRPQFDCDSCRYQFSATSGTIFHDTHLPLWKWFLAVYLMGESKKGISANQLKRTLKVSYKTAWYLCHRVRKAMQELNVRPLRGIVEVDETWVGGKRRYVGKGYVGNRQMVLGAIERGGPVRFRIEKRPSRKVLHKFIADTTAPDTECIMTDGHPAYRGIADHDTRHETVDHRAEEWVRGDVHTNSAEGVWSLFKRSIIGSYHQISAKHLQAYLDEFEFRFNNRDNPYMFRDTLLKLIHSANLEYKQLTAQTRAAA